MRWSGLGATLWPVPQPTEPDRATVTPQPNAGAPVVPLVLATFVAFPLLGLFTLLAIGDSYVLTHLRVVEPAGGPPVSWPTMWEIFLRFAGRFSLLIAGWLGLVGTWVAVAKGRRRLAWVAASVACGVGVGLLVLSVALSAHLQALYGAS